MATNYVERDGDWVRRAPFQLNQATMWLYVLPGDVVALKALCDLSINNVQQVGPTTNVTPISTTFGPVGTLFSPVLLVIADIKTGRSKDPADLNMGFIRERDVGFVVPVTLTEGGKVRTAALIPYLWVNNLSAMVSGREIYGFPKLLARMTFHPANLDFKAKSLALSQRKSTQLAGDATIVHVEAVTQPMVVIKFGAGALELVKATAEIVKGIFAAMGWVLPGGALDFDQLPLAFLKQFRSAADPAIACHQSIVEAVLPMLNFQEGSILPGLNNVRLGKREFPEIAKTLGLQAAPGGGGDPKYPTGAAFKMKFDFDLPHGKQLWP